jgi:hypothetical protein
MDGVSNGGGGGGSSGGATALRPDFPALSAASAMVRRSRDLCIYPACIRSR